MRVGCHCAASPGSVTVIGLLARRGNARAHSGQFRPSIARRRGEVRQECPQCGHSQQTPRFTELGRTPAGVSAPFPVGCHCAASSGCSTARLLAAVSFLSAQNWQSGCWI